MKTNQNLSHPKYYSNSNRISQDFKQSYLKSLQLILDDEKFKEKADTLPLLKSSVINKYEKILTRKKDRLKTLNKKHKIINQTETNYNDNITNEKQKKKILKNQIKIIQTRYIILDKKLTEISLKAIEESSEINNKLTDPFSSFFQEDNPKIRKNAIDQIMNNIFVVEDKEKEEKDKLPEINNKRKNYELDKNTNIDGDIFYKDLEAFENKFKLNTEMEKKNHEKYGNSINEFEEKCQHYNIVTLGQKIDLFSYLYNEENKKKQELMASKKSQKTSNAHSPKKIDKKTNYYNNLISMIKNNSPLLKRKFTLLRIGSKTYEGNIMYYEELKNYFKISEETNNSRIKLFGKQERDMNNKIKNFHLVKDNLEISLKLLDKLKYYFLFCDITPEKIILRECNINHDLFVFLISKSYFEFGTLKYLDLSKNNLGDIGGTYLLYLISKYSKNIEYLNLSYTSIKKNTCDILINSLSKNIFKIKTLNIGGNNLGDELFSEILVAISSNTYLNKLYINENNLGRIGSAVIGNFLKYDKKIKLLDVSRNNFDDEIIGSMLKGLIINSSLDILFLNELGLTNKSFRIFATTLSINTNLKKIFLEKNKFNFKAIQKLSDILNSNKYLEYISLVGNNFEYEHINYANELQRQIKLKIISKSEFLNQIGITEDKNNIYDYLQ